MPSSQRLAELQEDKSPTGHVILDVLTKAMKHIGGFTGLTGSQKKALVLQMIEYELELPEELETLIIALIDVLISVEGGELVFNTRIVPPSIYSCCTSRS